MMDESPLHKALDFAMKDRASLHGVLEDIAVMNEAPLDEMLDVEIYV